MTAVITERAAGRSLIPSELHRRLVRRIVVDEKISEDLANRIMDQTLAFLGTCAREHAEPMAPSELVDIGWHTFILHTREYAAFCQGVAGRFLHHVPTEDSDANAPGERACATLVRTVAAIDAAGFAVDTALWPKANTLACTGCHNGCHDDPPPTR
jgi:hypothetical protein